MGGLVQYLTPFWIAMGILRLLMNSDCELGLGRTDWTGLDWSLLGRSVKFQSCPGSDSWHCSGALVSILVWSWDGSKEGSGPAFSVVNIHGSPIGWTEVIMGGTCDDSFGWKTSRYSEASLPFSSFFFDR